MKILLLKYIFLVSIIMTPIIAISDVKVPGAVIVNDGAITNNCNGWHKLPPQQFVVFIDKPKVDSIYIYVKRKLKYLGEGRPEGYFQKYLDEGRRIRYFIRELKGVVKVYHSNSNSLVYERHFPFHDDDVVGGEVRDADGNEWVGLGFDGFNKKLIANFVVSTDFYSCSNEFSEYMVGLKQAYGTK